MSTNTPQSRNSNLWIGFIVLAIGFAWLVKRLDYDFFPYWVFTWKMAIIVIGIIIGVRKKFEGIGWLVLVIIGVIFLLEDITYFRWYLREYAWPVGVIIIGFFLVYRALIVRSGKTDTNRFATSGSSETTAKSSEVFGSNQSSTTAGEDFIDLTTVFGSIKKRIFSKNFKGGQTSTFFGSTELDFTQADIEGDVRLDMVSAFGGVELIVPSNWDVKSELTVILGGIEDKRPSRLDQREGNGKRLIITGTCMLGGVEIKSYS